MVQHKFTLRENVSVSDDSWVFTSIPPNVLVPHQPQPREKPMGKLIIFTPEKITLELARFPSNRMVYYDDPNLLILVSFGGLRFPDTKPSVATDYKLRFFQAGLFLNGVQYRFYGHSNSQLVCTRSKLLYSLSTDRKRVVQLRAAKWWMLFAQGGLGRGVGSSCVCQGRLRKDHECGKAYDDFSPAFLRVKD